MPTTCTTIEHLLYPAAAPHLVCHINYLGLWSRTLVIDRLQQIVGFKQEKHTSVAMYRIHCARPAAIRDKANSEFEGATRNLWIPDEFRPRGWMYIPAEILKM